MLDPSLCNFVRSKTSDKLSVTILNVQFYTHLIELSNNWFWLVLIFVSLFLRTRFMFELLEKLLRLAAASREVVESLEASSIRLTPMSSNSSGPTLCKRQIIRNNDQQSFPDLFRSDENTIKIKKLTSSTEWFWVQFNWLIKW